VIGGKQRENSFFFQPYVSREKIVKGGIFKRDVLQPGVSASFRILRELRHLDKPNAMVCGVVGSQAAFALIGEPFPRGLDVSKTMDIPRTVVYH
jgi:hypothetical protein